jgi:dihydrolipoamide dehydrogenase
VTGAKTTKKGATLTLEPSKGGKEETLDADVVLVAIGRKPYVDSLGLENVGVTRDKQGRIEVDAHFKAAEGVYAIGDVIAGPMLAHKAEEDGVAVAEIIAGQAGHVDYDLVPSVVYTYPEIAMIGKTEEQLKEAGVAYNKGKFPFMANSRARTMDETDGFVKILADKETDQVLGVHIIGPQAGTLIGEASVAMAYKAASEDIARICHSHPDLNEAIKEAALATFFKPIHM